MPFGAAAVDADELKIFPSVANGRFIHRHEKSDNGQNGQSDNEDTVILVQTWRPNSHATPRYRGLDVLNGVVSGWATPIALAPAPMMSATANPIAARRRVLNPSDSIGRIKQAPAAKKSATAKSIRTAPIVYMTALP